jgi:hypothetical protein
MATANSTPQFIAKDPVHQEVIDFLNNAKAAEGAEYGWTFEYAKTLWEYRNKTFAGLDEKAESIIRYLGGGTGLFAIGAIAKVETSSRWIAASALPAIICALVAIYFAFRSKKPDPFPGMPSIQKAKAYADDLKNDNEAKAAFLGQWNAVCEHARLICDRKAVDVYRASVLAFVALTLLILPLLTAIFIPK